MSTDRVFLKYSQGLCIKQVVGNNTFRKCPSTIARYLNLIDAHKYTGHAFRRTSATIMANEGMNVDEVGRQVGWKSSSTASGYIEESITNKLEVSKLIAGAVQKGGNIGSDISVSTDKNVKNTQISSAASQLTITNNQNCTFNIYLK
ncbi:Phage integrase family [Popillia japonica]|uniref:Phage integrase family n=1 Tax=Popillia japonica TaxID=7064 RepID=A0AAW1L9H4_POPJA